MKQSTFRDATTGFPPKLTPDKRAQMSHTEDLSLPCTSDCSCRERNLLQPAKSTTQTVWNYCARFSLQWIKEWGSANLEGGGLF